MYARFCWLYFSIDEIPNDDAFQTDISIRWTSLQEIQSRIQLPSSSNCLGLEVLEIMFVQFYGCFYLFFRLLKACNWVENWFKSVQNEFKISAKMKKEKNTYFLKRVTSKWLYYLNWKYNEYETRPFFTQSDNVWRTSNIKEKATYRWAQKIQRLRWVKFSFLNGKQEAKRLCLV